MATAAALTSSTDEPLLEVDPNSVGITYSVTRTGRTVTQERWEQTSNAFAVKTIDYTFAGGVVATEVRKVFSLADGTTVTAQKSITYAYSGPLITGYAATRDV